MNTDCLSSTGCILSGVDLHNGVTIRVDRNQTVVPGVRGGLEIDSTVGGVIVAPEIEVVEERISSLYVSASFFLHHEFDLPMSQLDSNHCLKTSLRTVARKTRFLCSCELLWKR